MHCANCGFDSPAGFSVCGKCGKPLALTCSRCAAEVPPGFAFCGRCGTPVGTPRPEGLTPAELDRLRHYLPPALIDVLQYDPVAPAPRLLEQCQTHLAQLLTTTASHLPAYLVERVAQDPAPGRASGQFQRGTLLFADISGFTAMSERLNTIGREGAEEITAIVNRYFSTMLAILREHGGQLIKFGGDALLGLFLEPPEESATRAVQAALGMQRAMADFTETKTSLGTFPLRMKVGLRHGQFFAAELGAREGMEFALFGPDVNATAAAESAAVAGQVLTDAKTAAMLEGTPHLAPGPEGYVVVERLDDYDGRLALQEIDLLAGTAEPNLENLRRLSRLLDALTPYLPAGLLARLSSDTRGVPQFEGEHRLVAIAFTNVLGLGRVVADLGPGREEQIIQLLNGYFTTMSSAIRQFGGVINKIDLYDQGDKLLAFFGAPVAHEDDAERAVRAAWAMRTALAGVNSALPAGLPALSQKTGISYGYVFAGYMGTDWRHEYTVMGDEVNLAARLMSAAQPDTVTVSSNVSRKVQGIFEMAQRGAVTLKGKSQPFHLYTVEGLRAVPEPVQRDVLRAPLVGREAEWQQVLAAARAFTAGRGQIIAVIGEAGLGKTRLAEELRSNLERSLPDSIRWIEGRGLSYTEAVSYVPWREMLRQLLGVRADDGDQVALAKIRRALVERLKPDELAAVLPYVLNFLDLPLDEEQREKVRYLEAEALQRRTFLALSRLIELYANEPGRPLALALDDLQWVDAASVDFLEFLMPVVERAAVLLLLIYRPERAKGFWKIHEKAAREFAHRTTQLTLHSLSEADSQTLLTRLVPLDPWPERVRNDVLARAEGNPLCIEEMLRIMVDKQWLGRDEAGRWQFKSDIEAVQVPDSLQGVLMTRLDALNEPTRRTTQIASVIGRNYAFDVLEAMSDETRTALNQHLSRLQQAEIAQELQRSPELIYTFRHGLMQEVCYENLLARTRRQHHRKIAAYLEEKHQTRGGELGAEAAFLAHHAFVGQDWPRAVEYQTLAGQHAQKLFANQAAIDHFLKALHAAEALPPEALLSQRQISHAALGALYTTIGQYELAFDHLARARELAGQLGDLDQEARACRWFARAHELRAEYSAALEWIARGLIVLGDRESAEAAQLNITAGLIHSRQGNHAQSLEYCHAAVRLAEALGELTVLGRAYTLLGHLTLLRGASAQALEHFQRALDLYTRAGDLAGQAVANNQLANAHFNLGRLSAADQAYSQARRTFAATGDIYNQAIADNNLGEIALSQGRLDDALAYYQQALSAMEKIGGSSYILGILHNNLGATLIQRGELEAAEEQLQTSQTLFEQAQSRDFLPELERHFANAALAQGALAEAEVHAQRALNLARELEMQNEVGINLRVLAEIALAQSQWDEARRRLHASLQILEELGDAYQSARTRLVLAQVYAAQGDAPAAHTELDRCEPVFAGLEAALDLAKVQALRQRLAHA